MFFDFIELSNVCFNSPGAIRLLICLIGPMVFLCIFPSEIINLCWICWDGSYCLVIYYQNVKSNIILDNILILMMKNLIWENSLCKKLILGG